MRIKICGLSREEDIDFVNEARPDYAGFVFAQSKRQVSVPLAQHLRFRLANEITPVGVFVNTPINDIAALFHNGVISIAQLHGDEDESYITQLKKKCAANDKLAQFKIIKSIKIVSQNNNTLKNKRIHQKQIEKFTEKVRDGSCGSWLNSSDYYLFDSGAGSGKSFDWKLIKSLKINKPWFLAGGISIKNIEQAAALKPFAVDVSSGAETKGIKDRKKILKLVMAVKGNIQ